MAFELSELKDSALSDLAGKVVGIELEARAYQDATSDIFAMRRELDSELTSLLGALKERPSRKLMEQAILLKAKVASFDSFQTGVFYDSEVLRSIIHARHTEIPTLTKDICERVGLSLIHI